MKKTILTLALSAGITSFAGNVNAQTLYVGNGSSGQTTNITSGTNTYSATWIGAGSTDSNNTLNVVNSGTLLTNSGNVQIGYGGSYNKMNIFSGATVVSSQSYFGYTNPLSVGNSAKVDGGTWILTKNQIGQTGIGVGWAGSRSSLMVTNGGKVLLPYSSLTVGRSNTSSNNIVTVTGSGSSISVSQSNTTFGNSIKIGRDGSGNSMIISDGGSVYVYDPSGSNAIGYNSGSVNNSVLVTGANSTWSNANFLDIGDAGSGTLTVANGGTFLGAGIVIANQSGSTGTLNIGRFGTNNAAGTIVAPTINFGNGGGTINFNQSDTATMTSSISGLGTVQQLGTGTTILTGGNSYTGTTLVTNGTLLANNTSGSAVGTSSVLVTNAGTLGGSGTVGGATVIGNGGSLIPGSGGLSGTGALTFTNGLTLQGGANTTFLINATNNFTSINLSGGSVQYGGTLTFNLTTYASLAAAGDSFTLFNLTGGATESGDFTALTAIGDSIIFTDNSGIWTGTDTSGLTYQFSGATGQLSVSQAVPEPSTYALFGIGALALIVAYRTKSRKVS